MTDYRRMTKISCFNGAAKCDVCKTDAKDWRFAVFDSISPRDEEIRIYICSHCIMLMEECVDYNEDREAIQT